MTFTQVTHQTLEDHPFDRDHSLVVQLRIPDVSSFDSLYHCKREDVSASVVFHFDEGGYEKGLTPNYQFNADTRPEDAMNVLDGPCSICSEGEPNFDCEVWFKGTEIKNIKYLCRDCLESFLEIRDELLEEFSGWIASEEL